MTIAKLLAENEAQRVLLEKEAEMLKRLPSNAPVERIARLGEVWHIGLAGDTLAALKALPPSNCNMYLNDRYWGMAPLAEPLNWNQRILPVLCTDTGMRWWHHLADGTAVMVSTHKNLDQAPPGYEYRRRFHSGAYVRQLMPLELATAPAPVDRNDSSVEALAIPRKDYVAGILAQAKEALAEFERLYLGKVVNSPRDSEVLTRWVQEKVGHAVKVSFKSRSTSVMRVNGGESIRHDVWIYFLGWNEQAYICTPAVYDPSGFDWLNPPFYRFVPNLGRFSLDT